ncbi:hypothetical protein [Paenibacillus planticolens]|uniref:S1 motif domain-containing protein n=1 Tax=Paenibacillus planticolens TaxID=2654976 RepID=A0ABX1ZHV6_9BACL|nr:hypothetical protein [Paenibacillus planticolens]NOU99455.1 hypothetical protein [Paenibacillus planticolens]
MDTWYFEVDEEGTAFRQIIINDDGSYIASNRKHETYHFSLADKEIDDNDPHYIRITEDEFEKVWSNYLKAFNDDWKHTKTALPIGKEIEGYIECFLPHGVIVNIFKYNAIGVADYHECSQNTPKEWLCPRHVVRAIVKDYDELNQWVVLDKPKILKILHAE